MKQGIAPQAGNMNQIPFLDWLPRAGLPVLFPQQRFAKSKGVLESHLSQNIFPDSKKIFSHFSVGMELENQKTETPHHFAFLGNYVITNMFRSFETLFRICCQLVNDK